MDESKSESKLRERKRPWWYELVLRELMSGATSQDLGRIMHCSQTAALRRVRAAGIAIELVTTRSVWDCYETFRQRNVYRLVKENA